MNPAVGIDLGTTNTVIGIQTDATGPRILPVPQPVLERNVLDERENIKSAVLFEPGDSVVVGAFAVARYDSFRSIKSKMGTRFQAKHPYAANIMLTPADISAQILRAAWEHVSRTFPHWDRKAIVTVPASFNTDQRRDTLTAALLAGFEDVRLLDEPTAAFYLYFDQYREVLLAEKGQNVLVFDFGGGTLDVSVIQVSGRNGVIHIDAIGRSRYNNLGGDDIDTDLAVFLVACWEHENARRINDLSRGLRRALFKRFIDRARDYKEEAEYYIAEGMALNDFNLDEEVFDSGDGLHLRLRRRVTRDQYDQLTGRYLHGGGQLNIFRPIGQALKMASTIRPGFEVKDLDLVLYTGGSSRMAAVRAELDRFFFPKRSVSLGDVDACNTVALGAACARYDEIHRGTSVRMTNRMLEGILTRDQQSGGYVMLVPPESVPSQHFKEVDHDFSTARESIQLRLPLFRGASPSDHQLSPVRDLRMPLEKVLAVNTPYRLFYRVSENKTVDLKARIETADGPREVTGEVEIEGADRMHGAPRRPFQVNVVRR